MWYNVSSSRFIRCIQISSTGRDFLFRYIFWSIWFLTLAGNLLVFAAFVIDPQLRANVFILNLALADFIVGINTLAINNILRYYGNWPFGKVICTVYMIFLLQCNFTVHFRDRTDQHGSILFSNDRWT